MITVLRPHLALACEFLIYLNSLLIVSVFSSHFLFRAAAAMDPRSLHSAGRVALIHHRQWNLSLAVPQTTKQISLRNIVHMFRCVLSGKSLTLSSVTWTSESKKRLLVLLLTTLGLLFGRFKVMGSQLPVFTR